jgi:hypothetical protein
MSRKDAHFQTFTGRTFYPLDPRVDDVCIEDIAHALSNMCRFCGHVRTFYSVAEHCVRGAGHLRGALSLQFLLHDAAEAYIVDLPRPLKRCGLFGWLYRAAECRVEAVIAEALGLPYPFDPVIKTVDERMLLTERRDLMPDTTITLCVGPLAPFPERITPMTPKQAERFFLTKYEALCTERVESVTNA